MKQNIGILSILLIGLMIVASCAVQEQTVQTTNDEKATDARGRVPIAAQSCSSNKDCPDNKWCSSGKCVYSCTDSDGGQDAYIYGSVQGRWADPELQDTSFADHCSSTDVKAVSEYYCGSDKLVYSTAISCKSGEVCNEGYCVPESQTVETSDDDEFEETTGSGQEIEDNSLCSDSDGGKMPETFGKTTGKQYNTQNDMEVTDFCNTQDAVYEGYCTDLGVTAAITDCPTGTWCDNDIKAGECVDSCTDSDGGYNTQVYGTVTGRMPNYEMPGYDYPVTQSDMCNTVSEVLEAYCTEEGYYASKLTACPSGTTCKDGACVK